MNRARRPPAAAAAAAALALALAAGLSGCASVTVPDELAPAVSPAARTHPGRVFLEVKGLEDEAGKADPVQVRTDELRPAVERAVTVARLFDAVTADRARADWVLVVHLVADDVPLFGGAFTARCEMAWQVARPDGTVAWRRAIRTVATVEMREAFVGMERARRARVRAARENIAQAVAAIGDAPF